MNGRFIATVVFGYLAKGDSTSTMERRAYC